MKNFSIIVNGKQFQILQKAETQFDIDGEKYTIEYGSIDSQSWIKISNQILNYYAKKISENEFEIWFKHTVFKVKVEDDRTRLLKQFSRKTFISSKEIVLRAPMPGLITSIEVASGDTVALGQGLIILEAMKMENEIRSPIKGLIKKILVVNKTTVEKDQPLIVIESTD